MLMEGAAIGAQETVSVTEITPELLVFATTAGRSGRKRNGGIGPGRVMIWRQLQYSLLL